MPPFCRHNRFLHNCPICSPRETRAPKRASAAGRTSTPRKRDAGSARSSSAVRVRRLARAEDDGYRSRLAPGLRASSDAERLADELGFAAGRLAELAVAPPGLYAEAASAPDRDEAAWLTAQLVLLGPQEGVEDPFAALREVIVPWAGGGLPDTELLAERGGLGPRSPYVDAGAARRGLAALRSWAERGGGPAAALVGDAAWTPERRFERLYERLGTLTGIGRGRYDLLVVLGRLGIADVRATKLAAGDSDDATLAAKRVFGIGDRLLLDRRAGELAEAAELPVEALDLALANLGRPAGAPRMTIGASPDAVDAAARSRAAAALGV